jgi:hypothetical protein
MPTLSPAITTHFAREAFPHLDGNPLDSAFCAACLQTGGAVGRELITLYICNRLERGYAEMGNLALHTSLAEILDLITGRANRNKGRGKTGGVMLIN